MSLQNTVYPSIIINYYIIFHTNNCMVSVCVYIYIHTHTYTHRGSNYLTALYNQSGLYFEVKSVCALETDRLIFET